ncbi:hypothetical protein [Pseudoxanthomonas indica]|uniref:hypothetical protein n=1 Tax=Pseudoxanthomonas indica TaxID=428993 RepID=UPI001115F694|nr:hypothetical protein [Pseudoxanthomonas indica]GGD52615.1 hypothetical protein GCM10007235_26020 [Pseudoxanthomonas indica]
MEKAGWQVTAFALGLACIGLTVGLAANKSALKETERQLENTRNARQHPTQHSETTNCATELAPEANPQTSCVSGYKLIDEPKGLEPIIKDGQIEKCS